MARIREGRRTLEVVDEDKEISLVGSIEVECVEGPKHHVIDRIVLLPPTGESLEVRLSRSAESTLYVDEDGEEGIEVPETILEKLTVAFLEGCQCGPYKSALRKPNRARGVDPHDPYHHSRTVSFSSLEIHEFDMTLGDHPSACSGPPVAIDWDSKEKERVVDLDEYERSRTPRRKRKQLKLSYRDRKGILEQQRGFSTEEVNMAWAEALKIRHQRQETLKRGMLMMMWDDFAESTQRKYRRVAETVGLQ